MAVQSPEMRKQQNDLLYKYHYRWHKDNENGKWWLYDPLGRVTTVDVALRDIARNTVPEPKPVIILDDRPAAVTWAKAIVKERPLILDTECTGLTEQDQVLEIALVELNGDIALNTLLQCPVPIAEDALAVHHIDAETLLRNNAPDYPSVHESLSRLISGRPVVIYNSAYDVRMLQQTAAYHGLSLPVMETHCLMRQFAAYYGERRPTNNYEQVPKKLELACDHFGISNDNAHRALDDAQAARLVLLRMAGGGLL